MTQATSTTNCRSQAAKRRIQLKIPNGRTEKRILPFDGRKFAGNSSKVQTGGLAI